MTLAWDDDRRHVVRWACTDELDWDDVGPTMALAENMLGSVSWPVHVFILVEGFRLPPDAPLYFPSIARRGYWQHPNLGSTIIVGPDHFFKMMIDIFGQVYGGPDVRLVAVQTLDEAYQLLRRSAS